MVRAPLVAIVERGPVSCCRRRKPTSDLLAIQPMQGTPARCYVNRPYRSLIEDCRLGAAQHRMAKTVMSMKRLCRTLLLTSFMVGVIAQIFASLSFAIERRVEKASFFGSYFRPAAAVPRNQKYLVFMGDSITADWASEPPLAQHSEYESRGVSGQTTLQMLRRFKADVVDLKPSIVHIMGGTNDVAENEGPESDEDIQYAISSMVDLAVANHIKVILASIPPAKRIYWHPGIEAAARIARLNAWLKGYASQRNITFADYWAVLADPSGGMKAEYSSDDVHPNAAGYAAMAPVLADALMRAEQQQ
jgi:lysophospholipase L1-like esterase